MKEHTRNVIIILCLIVIVQPWLVQNAYTAVDPEVYANFQLATNMQTKVRYWNSTPSYKYVQPTESITANNTYTITNTMTDQEESDPCTIYTAFAGTGVMSTLFNDTAFEEPAATRITSILLEIYSDDDAVAGVFKIGFDTGVTSDLTLIASSVAYTIASSATGVTSLRVYVPLIAYSTIDLNDRFDDAELVINFVADGGGDMSQTFTVHIVFEAGADYATWETYLLWLGLLNFGIAIGMTKMYDMTPGRRSYSRRRRSRRRT